MKTSKIHRMNEGGAVSTPAETISLSYFPERIKYEMLLRNNVISNPHYYNCIYILNGYFISRLRLTRYKKVLCTFQNFRMRISDLLHITFFVCESSSRRVRPRNTTKTFKLPDLGKTITKISFGCAILVKRREKIYVLCTLYRIRRWVKQVYEICCAFVQK